MSIAKYKCDVVIIGAGVSGLMCGCFLSKAGMDVLIAEKGSSPGGYCNSFKTKEYEFDGCVHTLGNVSNGSKLHDILSDFQIVDDLSLTRSNPSDVIIAPDFRISFWSNVERTIEELIRIFPEDSKGILHFFKNLIRKSDNELFIKYRDKTFRSVLNEFFLSEKLKSALSVIVLGDIGVPAQLISAFTAIEHYKQFIVGGGFYPKAGAQMLPNLLAKRFCEWGGKIIYSNAAKRIVLNNDKSVSGVVLSKGEEIAAKYVVSGCDARQTYLELVGRQHIKNIFLNLLDKMKPSLSLFVLYLGLKNDYIDGLVDGANNWFILSYDFDAEYNKGLDCEISLESLGGFLVCPNLNKKRVMVLTTAPYESVDFWEFNRSKSMDLLLDQVSSQIKGLKETVAFKTCTTPVGLNKWTMNYRGAAYGWASIPGQIMVPYFYQDKVIQNLYLSSHWATFGSGVLSVSIIAQKIANQILTDAKVGQYDGC